MITLMVVWYLVGVGAVAHLIYEQGRFTVSDILPALVFSVFGPLLWLWMGGVWIYEHTNFDRVIWTKKKS